MPAYMYTACGLSFEVSEVLYFGTNTAPGLTFGPAGAAGAQGQWLSAPKEQGLILPQDRQRGCQCRREIQEDLLVAAA